MAEMKAEGVEYDERMEELEKLEYPKPNRELIYSAFNAFAVKHPWVGQENIQPKSVAREMFEQFYSFADYVRAYDLQRSEGLLLRHLNNVYTVLAQTVPDAAKTEDVKDMETYLITMIRQVDSSLLEEWEKMKNPKYERVDEEEVRPPGSVEALADVTRDKQEFTKLVRNRIFTVLRAIANEAFEDAIATLSDSDREDGVPWTATDLSQALDVFFETHTRIRLDPEARNLRHTHVKQDIEERKWVVQQTLIDPDEKNDWMVEFHVDLEKSRTNQEPFVSLRAITEIGVR